MIKLAIVDDDMEMIEKICHLINIIEILQNKISIHKFNSAEQVLDELERGVQFDIILSDIEMSKMNGIEFGKIIRDKYPHIILIFLTSYPEYAVESYVLNAYQYILKSEMEKRLPDILQTTINKIDAIDERYRMVKTRFEAHKVYLKDIIYIKKVKGDKYSLFYTTNGTFAERISLEQILAELDSDEFIVAERGYIVNYRHISSLKGNILYLTDGVTVTISRARAGTVKEQIFKCWEKMQ